MLIQRHFIGPGVVTSGSHKYYIHMNFLCTYYLFIWNMHAFKTGCSYRLPEDLYHDDVIKWKPFSALMALCKGNPLVESPHKGQWCKYLIYSLICAWTNGWANNQDASDLRRHHAHYDVTVMCVPYVTHELHMVILLLTLSIYRSGLLIKVSHAATLL